MTGAWAEKSFTEEESDEEEKWNRIVEVDVHGQDSGEENAAAKYLVRNGVSFHGNRRNKAPDYVQLTMA
jgi:hypothetical protein